MTTPVDLSKLSPIGQLPVEKKQSETSTFLQTTPGFAQLYSLFSNVNEKRRSLGLESPGTMENLTKEVSKDIFTGNYFFSGLRAELSKSFCMNPIFQVAHSFAIGSPVMPSYALTALYANDDVFLQGNIDADLSLSARVHYGWTRNLISKANVQLANGQPSMIQLEQDYRGSDFSANLKALNPAYSEVLTGIFVGSWLQSITPALALGIETVYSCQSAAYPPDAAVSYVGKYKSGDWYAAAQMQAQGAVVGSFYRKITDGVEAGLETTLSVAPNQQQMMGMGAPGEPAFKVDASTTLGVKYEFRQSVFRGQVDSQGKVSCYLEKRVLPVISVLFAGEIDHFKSTHRLGVGLQFETGSEEVFTQNQPHPPM